MAVENVQYVLSLKDMLSGTIKDADNNVKKFDTTIGGPLRLLFLLRLLEYL
jgi:hypothetical protein